MSDLKVRYVYSNGKELKIIILPIIAIETGRLLSEINSMPMDFRLISRDRFTGSKIKNIDLFENDIIKARKENIYKVVFATGGFELYHTKLKDSQNEVLRWGNLLRLFDSDMKDILEQCEIISNTHIEELKEKKNEK